jgi:antitoxin component of RelBE/YafQ-DinJ toxin-antitoxin module
MTTTKVTLNIDTKIYEEFKKECKNKGLVLSKNVEIYMKNFTDDEKNGSK